MNKEKCPCDSGGDYSECCRPFHLGEKTAPTAEKLMRSRYSAFVKQDADYLLRTWHPSTAPQELDSESNLQWTGLTINGRKQGRKKDSLGWVTFVATYQITLNPLEISAQQETGQLHETSYFIRDEHDNWLYVNGEIKP
ncbi:hypothetical protein J3998_10325 [Thiomicrorhabdus sp. 6S2-11]|uniref:UPF0225 protein J3998_10325 n=1 Tax=Thiomicrorhabdus marina TaxID=2818442 RepID=A0ABS3Q821_9GAMM|nr:YchJ family metal-binding protein [Thiomicrorhabdus marina]MBO1927970.1 hypothetical protein [Thiomicrorhabdus marina]